MAQQIKKISKFSEDAINMALKTIPEKEWDSFQKGLHMLTTTLGEKEQKTPKTKQNSDESIFRNDVVPQIIRRLEEIENLEVRDGISIQVDFMIQADFVKMSDQQIFFEHSHLLQMETHLQYLTLITQFFRGMLYIELSDRITKRGSTLKRFIENDKELHVSYKTILRYMTMASIIANYPRLLLCDLSFSQILKHKKRLCKFLECEEGKKVSSRLSLPVEITAQGQVIEICYANMQIPSIKFSTDPDWKIHDVKDTGDKTDKEVENWVASCDVEDEETDLLEVM